MLNEPVMNTTQQQPGWYADPSGRFRFRWWDGSDWGSYGANETVEYDPLPHSFRSADADEKAPALKGLPAAFAGYFLGLAFAAAIHATLRAHDYPGGPTVDFLAGQSGLWLGLIGAMFYVSRGRGTGSIFKDFDFRFRKIDIGVGFAGGFGARILAFTVVSILIPLIPQSSGNATERDLYDRVANGWSAWAALFLVVVIGAPLIEELFFRGLMQPRLMSATNEAVGLGATAVLFGCAHLTNWQGLSASIVYASTIAATGLVLGLMRHQSGRLGTSIWAHAFFNLQAVLVSFLLTR